MTVRELNSVMEFDHVVRVLPDGTVIDAAGVWSPGLNDGELEEFTYIPGQPTGWRLMNGYSGQSGYAGPVMHPSEYIGGRMERDIVEQAGLYVAVANYISDGYDDCDDCDEADGSCDSHGIDGWAVAYLVEEL